MTVSEDDINLIDNSRVRRLLVAAQQAGLSIMKDDDVPECWVVRSAGGESLTIYGKGWHSVSIMLDDQVKEWREVQQLDALKLIMEWER